MKLFLILLFFTFASWGQSSLIADFLKTQELDAKGNFNGLGIKPSKLEFSLRGQKMNGVVDYIHRNQSQVVISLQDISFSGSSKKYPVYSTILLSKEVLDKRQQKFQSYGAISSEEANGFCRSIYGSDFHVGKQNPTSSRKLETDPWVLESLTCEGKLLPISL